MEQVAKMFAPYNPCDNCTHKDKCDKCTHKALQINYERALNKIIELSTKPITLIK